MRTLALSITGLGMVAAIPPPNCTFDDYENELGWYIDIPATGECLSATVTADDWTTCLTPQPVSENCTNDLGPRIAAADSVCNTPCASINSTNCRICEGVVALQQIALLVPPNPYGMCAGESDLNAIMAANWSTVAQDGAIFDLFSVANVSEICRLCVNSWNDSALNQNFCEGPCTNAGSADCFNCLNVYWGSTLASCSVTTWSSSCQDSDYESLTEMNPSIVKNCLETVENRDGLFYCLTNGTSVNLTEDCAASLDGQFDYDAFEDCTDYCADNTTVGCYNCKGALMAYETFSYASYADGSCGSEVDRTSISNVNKSDVYVCGESDPYAAATCLANRSEVSDGCSLCLTNRTAIAVTQCSIHCTNQTSVDCLECVNIGLVNAAAYCNNYAVLPNDTCTVYDYAQDLGWNINIPQFGECLTTEATADHWMPCLMNQEIVSEYCAEDLNQRIKFEEVVCDTPCASINSTDCRICKGVVALQQIAVLVPVDSPYGMCASENDRNAIIAANWSAVAESGSVFDLFSIVNVSEICAYCVDSWEDEALSEEYCDFACIDAGSADCYNCLNVWWVSALAYCSSSVWDSSCEDSDFESLTAMNPSVVKECMETVDESSADGLFRCLTDGTSVNLTQDCAASLDGQFEYYAFDDCTDYCADSTSVGCFNCKGAIMVEETFAYASIAYGSCGTETDRDLISNVNMSDVYICGATDPYAGANCIANQSEVSDACSLCLTNRTAIAVTQCSVHCTNQTSVDCLECVNIGLVNAAAYCNAFQGFQTGECTVDDYSQEIGWNINIPQVGDCLTANADDWTTCLADQEIITESCIAMLNQGIVDDGTICDTPCESINSTDCRICKGVVALQQISELVPEGSPYGMCASENDRNAIIAANWSAVAEGGAVFDLFSIVNVSEICTYCIDSWLDQSQSEEYCGIACTDPESADCLNCLNVWWVSSLAYCSSTTWDSSCEDSDFESLAYMDPSVVKECMETSDEGSVDGGLYHCLSDGTSVNLTQDCAASLVGQFEYYAFDECTDHCSVDTSIECYNCQGAIMVEETFSYASLGLGSCGGEEDRILINDVNMDDVFVCGESDPYAGARCLATVAGVSGGCTSCLNSRTTTAVNACSAHCGDSNSVDCLECVNIGLINAAAYCNAFQGLPEVICSDADYEKLSEIDAGDVTTCLEGDGDGELQLCLGNVETYNISDTCAGPLQAHIEDAWLVCQDDPICAGDAPSADCMNCRGSIMVQEIFANAPEASGDCGDSDNLIAMADVDITAVIACGSEQAYTGATCLAFQAGASPRCHTCLEEGTAKAIMECDPHCLANESGADCMNCVNIGLMSAAAHCNSHLSGSAGMTGLSLISLAAILSLVFVA